MPKMALTISHSLGTEEAKRRITNLVAETQKQFGGMISDLEESWSGDTGSFHFRVMGFAIAGRLEVEPALVQIEISFPFAALPFKSRVETEILSQAKALLA